MKMLLMICMFTLTSTAFASNTNLRFSGTTDSGSACRVNASIVLSSMLLSIDNSVNFIEAVVDQRGIIRESATRDVILPMPGYSKSVIIDYRADNTALTTWILDASKNVLAKCDKLIREAK